MTAILSFLFKLLVISSCYLLIAFSWTVSAAEVTLQWDANSPMPEGYRLFMRTSGGSYDYQSPKWTGTGTVCTIDELNDGISYRFVVRAYDGDEESSDSNEVTYLAQGSVPPSALDSDGDNVNELVDAFPFDPTEWLDTDGDGIGDNADLDDDDDGMPDVWEIEYGLNPLIDDADQDLNGDGIINLEEFYAGTDPSQVAGNTPPAKPLLDQPQNGALVGLMPTLRTKAFSDPDGDSHARTLYQISMTADFNAFVFEYATMHHLTGLALFELLLDPDTSYYWRVKFFDNHNGSSEWSAVYSFRTIDFETAGDANVNGVLDHQELDGPVDFDANGVPDWDQADMLGVKSSDPLNTYIVIQKTAPDIDIVAAQSIAPDQLSLVLNQPDQMTGLISFKLFLNGTSPRATVIVHFSEPAPLNARWYKYDPENGWAVYPNAAFSMDRRSISIMLEDGGAGDQDGVKNGIIIDPSGLGYGAASGGDGNSWTSASDSAAAGCFIQDVLPSTRKPLKALVFLSLGLSLGAALVAGRILFRKR